MQLVLIQGRQPPLNKGDNDIDTSVSNLEGKKGKQCIHGVMSSDKYNK